MKKFTKVVRIAHEDVFGDGLFTRDVIMVHVALRRCPFCKGKGLVKHSSSDELQDGIYIECKECGNRTNDFPTHEKAAAAWNVRYDDADNEHRIL